MHSIENLIFNFNLTPTPPPLVEMACALFLAQWMKNFHVSQLISRFESWEERKSANWNSILLSKSILEDEQKVFYINANIFRILLYLNE
jgi:hypothetical protein